MKVALSALSARHPQARADAPPALRGATIDVARGEHVAIIGPSGAGKTTLLHAIACALEPVQAESSTQASAITLDDTNPWGLSRAARQQLRGRLLLAPQVPPLPPRQRVITSLLAAKLPTMSVWQSTRTLLHPSSTDIQAAHDALVPFDLAEKLFHRVDRLSGGERQRVGLARALLTPGSLWLIDEPLSALDPTRATMVMDTLISQATARNATLIMTLHQVEVAISRFPRVIGLRDGEVKFNLPAQDVTPARLKALYAQHEDELTGPAPVPDIVEVAAPIIMGCR
jgi:phosphonate transport system ATP-binding protein